MSSGLWSSNGSCSFDLCVCDGALWGLKPKLTKGRRYNLCGSNAFPSLYKALVRAFKPCMIKPGGKCVKEIHEPSKADWKLFRERVPEGQEKYIARLCDEYAAILTGKDRRYEAFWTIEKRIQEDKKRPDVMAQISKSEMP